MSENHENRYQLRAAVKAFEWLRRSKPAVAARRRSRTPCAARCKIPPRQIPPEPIAEKQT